MIDCLHTENTDDTEVRLLPCISRKTKINNHVEYTVNFGLYHVYGLEEDGSLLQEGGVRLSVWALRARSYKTRAEA